MELKDEITKCLEEGFADARIEVNTDANRAHIVVISNAFEGLTAVKRQQLVYGFLNDFIRSGALHAVTIKAQTPS